MSSSGNSAQGNNFDITGIKYIYQNHYNGQQETSEKKSICFDVSKPVKSFTGRNDELEALHSALQSESGQVVISQITSISGLGGIGKSELARKYAWDYKKCYYNNVWINAETQESFKKSFQELAKELKIAITEKRDEKEQERDIKSIVKDIYKYFQDAKSLFI